MQKVIKSNEFIAFKNNLNEIIKKIIDVKNNVNVKYNIEKYNQIIEGNDSDVLTQYETWYDQLQKVVINNDNTIKQSNEAKEQLNELVEFIINSKLNDNLEFIINKEKENNNEIKETLNSVVDKMIDKEKTIFNKKLKELKGLQYPLDSVTYSILQDIFPTNTRIQQDKEIVELIPSFNKLKEWSGKQICSVLFDSKIDGDGANNVLKNRVINKKNMYFISFDNENNVYGGYVNTIIDKTDCDITDPNSFVFSLIRNGKMKNIKYNIKNDKQQYAFYLNSDSDYLYRFGYNSPDILVWKNGISFSACSSGSYEYNDEQHPLVDKIRPLTTFATKRILVIQMS